MADKPDMHEILNETDEARKKEKYNAYVKEVTPTHNWILNMGKAFLTGGLICTLGQGFQNWFKSMGLSEEAAASYGILCLIFLSVLLTGLQIYQRLAKFGGAGTVVPITGFANAVAAPAIEFKKDASVIIGTRSKEPRKIKGFG